MTADPLYLIDGSGALARFRVSAHEANDGFMVFLHDGASTRCFSPEDALALSRALLAVGSGKFEVAETELAIQLREEDRTRRLAIQSQNRSTSDAAMPRPTLENL